MNVFPISIYFLDRAIFVIFTNFYLPLQKLPEVINFGDYGSFMEDQSIGR